MPPEAFGESVSMAEEDVMMELQSASNWDVATRYHEFKTKPGVKKNQKLADHLRKISARAIIERAQSVLGSVVHPVELRTATLDELPSGAEGAEIDLDETIENSPLAVAGRMIPEARDLYMQFQQKKTQSIVLSVDTSLSMTGEKLALTAVALAVVLLQFPDDPIGIVAFENEARVLKAPDERLSIEALLERFLDVPAQGYTHLEIGMKTALRLSRIAERFSKGRRPSTVLLTDGKYTAGRDPAYLAPKFPHLVVLKMGAERASRDLCRELAQKGRGALREVDDLEVLPQVMYGVVKDLLRGRSLT